MRLILGSSSQGRKDVMSELFENYECISPDIDEKAIRSDDAIELVEMIAKVKMRKIVEGLEDEAIVICADQVCEFDGEIKEKPYSLEEARDFLRSYSGKSMKKINGVVVANTVSGKFAFGVDEVKVDFKNYDDSVIDKLLETPQVLKVSGGVYYDDFIKDIYIESIVGSKDSLFGLPKVLTLNLLKDVGYE